MPDKHGCPNCGKNYKAVKTADQHWGDCTKRPKHGHECTTCHSKLVTADALSTHSAAKRAHAAVVPETRCKHPACLNRFKPYTAPSMAQHLESHTGARNESRDEDEHDET